jgi:AP-4 complex subunit mu-1
MVRIRLWADIPLDKAASGLEVEIPLPAHVTRVHCEVDQPGAAALQVGRHEAAAAALLGWLMVLHWPL